MVDSVQVLDPGFRVTDANDDPVNNAKIKFREIGPGATRTVYSDKDLAVPLGHTVRTRSDGFPVVSEGSNTTVLIYTGNTPYHIEITDADDVAIFPAKDNVRGALDTDSFVLDTETSILEVPVVSKTGNDTILAADKGKLINANANGGAFTLTLDSAITLGDGWNVKIRNDSTANLVTVAASQNIASPMGAVTSFTLRPGEGCAITCNGTSFQLIDYTPPFLPMRSHSVAENMTLVASVAGNALTIALKTLAGTDPSVADPIRIPFRSATAGDGSFSVLDVVAATSIIVPSGATLGSLNSTPFKVWLVAFNDGGTLRLGVINCVSGSAPSLSIFPLGQFPLASSTAIGGGSNSAGTFYTNGAGVSSKAYCILGYFTYESGLATAGTWSATPTRLHLYNESVPLPGTVIQRQRLQTGTMATGTPANFIPEDNTIPQSNEGDQYMSMALTASCSAHVLDVKASGYFGHSSARMMMALFRDSGVNAIAAQSVGNSGTNPGASTLSHRLLAGFLSASTFALRAASTGGVNTFNGLGGAALFGGVLASFMEIEELAT